MHGTCPTVKIKSDNDSGHVVINEHDFDESKHERFVDTDTTEDQPKRRGRPPRIVEGEKE